MVRMCFTVELPRKNLITTFPVAMRFGDTPVPIPNTMVKTEAAEDTMLETAWESRWLPDPLKKVQGKEPMKIEPHQEV